MQKDHFFHNNCCISSSQAIQQCKGNDIFISSFYDGTHQYYDPFSDFFLTSAYNIQESLWRIIQSFSDASTLKMTIFRSQEALMAYSLIIQTLILSLTCSHYKQLKRSTKNGARQSSWLRSQRRGNFCILQSGWPEWKSGLLYLCQVLNQLSKEHARKRSHRRAPDTTHILRDKQYKVSSGNTIPGWLILKVKTKSNAISVAIPP